MPFVSKAQSRAFHAAEHDPAVAKKIGIPQKVAKKFVSESHGQKVGKLPERVQRKAKGGAVSRNRSVW